LRAVIDSLAEMVAVLGVPTLSAFAGAASRLAREDSFWAAWQKWLEEAAPALYRGANFAD